MEVEYWENTKDWELDGEEWRDINGYEGSYQVSNLGRARSLRRKVFNPSLGKEAGFISWPRRILKQDINHGYTRVTLSKNGKTKRWRTHKLVLSVFSPAEKDSLQINHINGDKKDNRLENLEWVTQRENILHSVRTGLRPSTSVRCIEENKIFKSVTKAAKWAGVKASGIFRSLKKPHVRSGGYHWEVIGERNKSYIASSTL